MSYDANDPSFNHVLSAKGAVANKAGLFGAYTAGFLNDVFGVGAVLWPLVFGALGAAYVSSSYTLHWWRWCGFFLLTICLLMAGSWWDMSLGDLAGGGMVGNALYDNARRYLSPVGSTLLWLFVLLIGLQLACNFSWFAVAERLVARARAFLAARQARTRASADEGQPDAAGMTSGQFAELPRDAHPGSVDTLSGVTSDAESGNAHPADAGWPGMVRRVFGGWLRAQPGAEGSQPLLARIRAAFAPRNPAPGPMPEPLLPPPDAMAETGADAAAPALSASEAARDDDGLFAQLTDTMPDVHPGRQDSPDMASASEQPADTPSVCPGDSVVPPVAPASARPDAGAGPNGTRAAVMAGGPGPAGTGRVATSQGAQSGHEPRGRKARIPLPPLDLLAPPAPAGRSREDVEGKGRALMACLKDFDIQGDLVRITPGPVVTMYEVRPAPGIRVSRIANLSDDLSLALKAVAVRIQAPIPGSDTVGIEIPNNQRQPVNFRELAASDAFRKGCGPLTMILGKDIAGRPQMADLTRMPHLLVAGATGAGKSVCLNSILVSLLFRTQPDDLRLLLIDPKRIEMAAYADEPHLIHPVVTEMADAKNALEWAVQEMDNRYKHMARLGVRNVAAYNQKLASYRNDLPADFADLEKIPYLVIVIDELADLMMTAAREVETSVVRLAQLARAAGIHMILATQRPSVDVVTGLIKANFPCRISFQVTSRHDSRTILDQVGAEHLLGRGDMLFKPSGGRLQRLHGPFLSDEEVQAVVGHWKRHMAPRYMVDFAQWAADAPTGAGGGDAVQDALYEEARAFVLQQGRASISLLQRQFNIGFNRSARLMEQFEREGLIGPANGSKPRAVIR